MWRAILLATALVADAAVHIRDGGNTQQTIRVVEDHLARADPVRPAVPCVVGCDGVCKREPKVYDECSVCGGPGVKSGNGEDDDDAPECCPGLTKGCDGACKPTGSEAVYDSCSQCGGSGAAPGTCCPGASLGCDGECAVVPAIYDECSICDGNGPGCNGLCGASAKVDDSCGVCGGTGPSGVTGCCGDDIKGCDGVCGSLKVYDACSRCGGSGTNVYGCCRDRRTGCDGKCARYPLKYDACSVCGGPGLAYASRYLRDDAPRVGCCPGAPGCTYTPRAKNED